MRSAALRALLLVATLSVGNPAGTQEPPPRSARLAALLTQFRANRTALDSLLAERSAAGLPLLEPLPLSPDSTLVTLLYRGDGGERGVRVVSNGLALLARGELAAIDTVGRMRRFANTDLWYFSFAVPERTRLPYHFDVDRTDSARKLLDPFNRRVWARGNRDEEESVLELPSAPSAPWRDAESRPGGWDTLMIGTGPGARHVRVHVPAGRRANAGSMPIVVAIGAVNFIDRMGADRIVDSLARWKRIPPVLLVVTPEPSAADERDGYSAFARFLATEVVPAVRAKYRATAGPARTIVTGISRRGLVASIAAARHPERFGNVLALSGGYYWRPIGDREYEWFSRMQSTSGCSRVNWFLSAGVFENVVTPTNRGHYMLLVNRHLRDVLLAKGEVVRLFEFGGIHHELDWQDAFAEGLPWLLSRPAARPACRPA